MQKVLIRKMDLSDVEYIPDGSYCDVREDREIDSRLCFAAAMTGKRVTCCCICAELDDETLVGAAIGRFHYLSSGVITITDFLVDDRDDFNLLSCTTGLVGFFCGLIRGVSFSVLDIAVCDLEAFRLRKSFTANGLRAVGSTKPAGETGQRYQYLMSRKKMAAVKRF